MCVRGLHWSVGEFLDCIDGTKGVAVALRVRQVFLIVSGKPSTLDRDIGIFTTSSSYASADKSFIMSMGTSFLVPMLSLGALDKTVACDTVSFTSILHGMAAGGAFVTLMFTKSSGLYVVSGASLVLSLP